MFEVGRKSGVPGRGEAFPSLWFSSRLTVDPLIGRLNAGVEEPEPQLAVVVCRLPFPLALVVIGPQFAAELTCGECVEGFCFWALARVQVRTSTQPKNVAILLKVYLLRRGRQPLAWNGPDHNPRFPKNRPSYENVLPRWRRASRLDRASQITIAASSLCFGLCNAGESGCLRKRRWHHQQSSLLIRSKDCIERSPAP